MDFKRKRLMKALEEKTHRVKLVHGKKGWIAVGMTFVTLFGVSIFGQKTVDASAVNNVATVNTTNGSSIPLWNDVTTNNIHRSNRGLQNGTSWKTDKAVIGVDGKTYLKVSTNEYANIDQMDLQDETSKQDLSGVIHVGNNTQLYSNPLDGAKPISNRALAANTDWKTDTKVTVDGVTYYRVSTDEWVKAEDSNLISETSRSDKTYIANDPDAEPLPDTDTDTDTDNNGNNNNSGSGDTDGGGTTTPTQTKADVTLHYVDESGKAIDGVSDKTESGTIGENYQLTDEDKTVDGYDYVSDNSADQVIGKDGTTITVKLSKTQTTADVTLHYVDETGKAIDGVSDKTESGTIGENYQLTDEDKTVDGYDYVSDDSADQLISKDGTKITVTLSKTQTTAE